MSEFECKNSHLMRSSDRFCPRCNEPASRMDGMSRSELRYREREEYPEPEVEEEDS